MLAIITSLVLYGYATYSVSLRRNIDRGVRVQSAEVIKFQGGGEKFILFNSIICALNRILLWVIQTG